MKKKKFLHAVILKSDFLGSEREYFSSLGYDMKLKNGGSLFHLICNRIDDSHLVYLSATVCLSRVPGETREVLIPHNLVAAILQVQSQTNLLGFVEKAKST